MPISGFSITDGKLIPAKIANYETYKDKLPVCGTCFGEICLVKTKNGISYWRHFPGVGVDCPDKSKVKSVLLRPSNYINRKQSLALFKQRFLEILDIGIKPEFKTQTDTQLISFTTDDTTDIASVINTQCQDGTANFNNTVLNIYKKHRRRTDIIAALTDVSIKNLYDNEFMDWKIDLELQKQVVQIQKQYLEVQRMSAHLATSYIFTKGRENILKKLLAYSWIIHAHNQTKSTKKELAIRLIISSIATLASIHWYGITSALLDKRKPSVVPCNTKFEISTKGLEILVTEFNLPMPKQKPRGFGFK
ncbi:MAG: hypothetical protein AAFW70_23790 [Cyanobacteria bacterium J06635_10]